jgi:hypothetical protein
MRRDLHEIAVDLFALCSRQDIKLNIAWIPRELNEEADLLSKHIDPDDWEINPRVFKFLQDMFQEFTLDPFANNANSKCKTFYSRWWCEGTSGVDGLCFSWSQKFCWVVPPPHLISKVLSHIEMHKATGVAIFPKWVSSAFWPLLYPDGNLRMGWNLVYEYKKLKQFFQRGQFANLMFSEESFSGSVLVLSFNCIKW